MKKLVILLSVVAVSFALQAGDSPTPTNDKATCDKAKTAGKGCCPSKGCCPGKPDKDTAKQPVKSPKDAGNS